MADGDSVGKWPSPITFDDDDPKKGFAYVTLKMKELKADNPLFGKAKVKNGSVDVKFETGSIAMETTLTDGSETYHYVYKKSLPVDIDPEKSEFKVKNGRVVLILCKAKDVTWAAHADHFIKKT